MAERVDRFGIRVFCGLVATGSLAFVLSWLFIDPHLEDADVYPGGLVLRDNADNVLRVSLGKDDTDCRPYYVAEPDDWIWWSLEEGMFMLDLSFYLGGH